MSEARSASDHPPASVARGLLVVAILAALVASVRLLAGRSVEPPTDAAPGAVCPTPVEVARAGEATRVSCAGDPALAGCGGLAPGDLVELAATGCVRRPGGMSAPARVAMGIKLDVNTAGADDLALLDGIGPRLAAAIVAEREAHGPFVSLADLRRVRGVGPRVLERLTPVLEAGPAGTTREGP